jgi:Zn-dependent peptidase ImmA (M78 family)/DNA-binding XRE family transcriptional regulator
MLGERIQRARKAAGLSQEGLGRKLELSKMTLSKFERGLQTPSSKQLIALAKALQVRSEYFFRPQRLDIGQVEYRKRANTPQKLLDRIKADVLEQAERWEELLSFYPQPPIAPFTLPQTLPAQIQTLDEIEAVAEAVQDAWQLGCNPIPDVIDTLEAHGVLVIVTDKDERAKFDGLAGTVNHKPMVSVGSAWPGDRQRFTLAHELGHLVLNGRLAEDLDEEKACHRFAGAFLLPRQAVMAHFGGHRSVLEWQELYLLKHEFGLSMGACLFRLRDCGVISDSLSQKLWKNYAAQAWRKQEPGAAYPSEQTVLFKQLVYWGLAEDYFGESKAAELLGIPLPAFHRQRRTGSPSRTASPLLPQLIRTPYLAAHGAAGTARAHF